jgi:hypothetical protein
VPAAGQLPATALKMIIKQPLSLTETNDKFDIP